MKIKKRDVRRDAQPAEKTAPKAATRGWRLTDSMFVLCVLFIMLYSAKIALESMNDKPQLVTPLAS